MTVYIITVAIVILFEPILNLFMSKQRAKKIYVFIVGIWMFGVLALRSEIVGNDLVNYLPRYIIFGNSTWNSLLVVAEDKATEIGYAVLNKLLFSINESPRTIMVVSALIIIYCWCLSIYYDSLLPRLSFITYIGLSLYTSAFSGLRQATATAICITAHRYLKERKFKKYCLIVLLAATIHKSALIMIPVYFLFKIKISLKMFLEFIGILILCVAFGGKIIVFIADRFSYGRYLQLLGQGSGALGVLVIYLFFLISTFLFLKNYYIVELRIYIYSLFILILFSILTFYLPITGRIMSYFNALLVIELPNFIAKIKNVYNRRVMLYICGTILMAYYFLIICRADTSGIIPYKFM